MSDAALIYSDLPGALPAQYRLAPGEDIQVSAVSARFDGTAAAGTFLPCFAVYSQDGKLIGRWTPGQEISVGSVAVVTFSEDGGAATASSPYSAYEVVSAASNNAAVIKASGATLHGWYCMNTAGTPRYVKLYDKASSPSPGSDTPKWVIALPAGSAANVLTDNGISFPTGLAIAIVTGISNTDNTAVAASDVVASIAYA